MAKKSEAKKIDREAVKKQAQVLKTKARAARKAKKGDQAKAFRAGARRLQRVLKATAPRGSALHKQQAEAAPAAAEAAPA